MQLWTQCRAVWLAAALFAPGCARQLNNPFVDSGAWARAALTTPSAQGFREANQRGAQLQRVWPKYLVYGRNGYVTHWPVWWEDPVVDQGNDRIDPADPDRADPCFAVNWVDYLAIAYSPARCALNTALWPISAIVHPPGTVMVSDGRLSRAPLRGDYDSERAVLAIEPPHVVAQDVLLAVTDDVGPPPLASPLTGPLMSPSRPPSTQVR